MKQLMFSISTLAAAIACTGLTSTASAQSKTQKYAVVINHEEQYSVWPADMAPRAGWKRTGRTCVLEDCLSRIEEVWTDMRPLSIRRRVEADVKRAAKIRAAKE